MILQRLASAIRHQNWSQIITEILIVVIGIFLGLQVQAWYDGRQAAAEEQRIVGYLIYDMENTVADLERRQLTFLEQIHYTDRVIEILKSGVLKSEDIPDFEAGLLRQGRSPSLDTRMVSFYDENLNHIRDSQMRHIIDDYLSRFNGVRSLGAEIKRRLSAALDITMKKAVIHQGIDGILTSFYDFDMLKEDREFLTLFMGINRYEIVALGTVERSLRRSKTLLAVLKKYQVGEELEEVIF